MGSAIDTSKLVPVPLPGVEEGIGVAPSVGVGVAPNVGVGVGDAVTVGDVGRAEADAVDGADVGEVGDGEGDGLGATTTVNEYRPRWSSPSSAEKVV